MVTQFIYTYLQKNTTTFFEKILKSRLAHDPYFNKESTIVYYCKSRAGLWLLASTCTRLHLWRHEFKVPDILIKRPAYRWMWGCSRAGGSCWSSWSATGPSSAWRHTSTTQQEWKTCSIHSKVEATFFGHIFFVSGYKNKTDPNSSYIFRFFFSF